MLFFDIAIEETMSYVLHLRLYKVNVLGWTKTIIRVDAKAFSPP